jgi:DNA-binding transcriptional ArsR family regulator
VRSGGDIAEVAKLIANPGRTAMLDLLLDGEYHTAGELSVAAGVAPSTASSYLGALEDGGLIKRRAAGRQQRFALSGADVSKALEALAQLAPDQPVRSLREHNTKEALRAARTCYDHLAGRLGVQIVDALSQRGALVLVGEVFDVTPKGVALFTRLGIDVESDRNRRRAFARGCVDWSERRPHLGGAVGASLCARLRQMGWFRRRPSSRAVVVTEAGRAGLAESFGIHWAH